MGQTIVESSIVTVFEYEYFDRTAGSWCRGARLATAQRIAKLGGVLIGSSAVSLPRHEVGVDGFASRPRRAKRD